MHRQRLFLSFLLEKKEIERMKNEKYYSVHIHPLFRYPKYRDHMKAILRHFRHPRFNRCCIRDFIIIVRQYKSY